MCNDELNEKSFDVKTNSFSFENENDFMYSLNVEDFESMLNCNAIDLISPAAPPQTNNFFNNYDTNNNKESIFL